LEKREALRGVDAERFEHARRQHLAHAPFQGETPIAGARPGRAARALGREIEKPILLVIGLREEEAASVADLGVVNLELMAVIAKRQRMRVILGQGKEAGEM